MYHTEVSSYAIVAHDCFNSSRVRRMKQQSGGDLLNAGFLLGKSNSYVQDGPNAEVFLR